MTSCTTCLHLDEPSDGPHCGPCDRYVNFEPIDPPQRSAPYTDTQRINWLMPLLSLGDDPQRPAGRRTAALAAAYQIGKAGREAIDFAMEGSP